MYRKEYYERAFSSEYIREIYEKDSQWTQLQKRRTNLFNLMKRAQDFLRQPEALDDQAGGQCIKQEFFSGIAVFSSQK